MRIATRSSPLALAQTRSVADAIDGAELLEVESYGAAGDKERFVRGVEGALLEGRAEAGVHSAKDLPGAMTAGLAIVSVPRREDACDVWLGPGRSLAEVPAGATVGTVSRRRRSQLLALRPDLNPVEMHGNVDTRIRRLREGEVDGLVLAMAGLCRLGRQDEAAFAFGPDEMVPASGQGALVVQARSGEQETGGLRDLNDFESERRLLAERATVVALGADCSSPVGVHALIDGDRITLEGFVGLEDGSEWIRDSVEGSSTQPEAVGRELARRMVAAGAGDLLEAAAGEEGS